MTFTVMCHATDPDEHVQISVSTPMAAINHGCHPRTLAIGDFWIFISDARLRELREKITAALPPEAPRPAIEAT